MGAVLRVARAWASRMTTDPDPAVVGLMAKHMAEGTDWPLFFYGQRYMGSLEPTISALLMKVTGCAGGFVLSLGTALAGWLALWVLWRWARDAGGEKGGVAALLFALTGPLTYFQFQAAARGGYMVALALEGALLWMGTGMGWKLWTGQKVERWRFGLLGLCAGLGLWTNLNTAPFAGLAALAVLLGMRGRFWKRPREVWTAVGGAVAGAGPWLWDLCWRGGELVSGEATRVGMGDRWRAAGEHFGQYLWGGFAAEGWAARVLVTGLVLALAAGLWALLFGGRGHWRRDWQDAWEGDGGRGMWAAWMAVAATVAFTGVYVVSSFAMVKTGRYWIPVTLPLAVLAGLGPVRGRGWGRLASWTGLGLWASAALVLAVDGMGGAMRRCRVEEREWGDFTARLEGEGTRELYAANGHYFLNFFSGEELAVTDGKKLFYRPVLKRVEMAERQAFAEEVPGFMRWLRNGGDGGTVVEGPGGFRVHCGVRGRACGGRLLDVTPVNAEGRAMEELTDRNVLTDAHAEAADEVLEWRFAEPTEVGELRLVLSPAGHRHGTRALEAVRLEILREEGGDWEAFGRKEWTGLKESGGRLYPSLGERCRAQRWTLDTPAVRGLRATLETEGRARGFHERLVAEAMLQERGEEGCGGWDAESVGAVGDLLEGEYGQGAWVYAPRRLAGLLEGRLGEGRLAKLPRHVFRTRQDDGGADEVFCEGQTVVMCVEERWAALTEEVLGLHVKNWTEREAGGWRLYRVEAEEWRVPGVNPFLTWEEDFPLIGRELAPQEVREAWFEGLDEEERRETLRILARTRPAALWAVEEEEVEKALGEAGVALRDRAGVRPRGAGVGRVVFADGIVLEGVEVEPAEARAGETVTVRLYWKANGKARKVPESTFVHLCREDGSIVAQADWAGLVGRPGTRHFGVPLNEAVTEERVIRLPEWTEAGPLTVRVGRHREGWRWRVKIREAADGVEVKRRAAEFGGLLEVAE